MQDEIKQRVPFRSREQEALLGLLRTADLVRRRIGQVVEPAGLTPQQYNVLRILRGAGPQGLPTLEIAERMVEHAPGITRLLERLERKGLVRRRRCPEDARRVLCFSSPAGLALLARLDPAIAAADGEPFQGFSTGETGALVDLLDRVRDTLARGLTPALPHPSDPAGTETRRRNA
jgi:DNA-binding MarR family transcriptional regulator